MHSQRLFPAVLAGDLAAVTALLDEDPGLLQTRHHGESDGLAPGDPPLLAAAAGGHLALVKLLVERGAAIYEAGGWGYPAVAQAGWQRHDEVVAWFLGDGARHETMQGAPTYGLGIDVNLAARFGWLEVVQAHLQRDPLAVYRRGVIGETPLHWAGHNGHLEVVDALLAAGAPIEADEIGLYGGKPLHWAAEHEPAVVARLLAAGATVDSRNLQPGDLAGCTPLIMCARQRNDCAECAELLLAAGADPQAVDAQGRTALEIATTKGHARVAAVLRER